jgi:hypothetical protein
MVNINYASKMTRMLKTCQFLQLAVYVYHIQLTIDTKAEI